MPDAAISFFKSSPEATPQLFIIHYSLFIKKVAPNRVRSFVLFYLY